MPLPPDKVGPFKKLEWFLKRCLAWALAGAFYRPGRPVQVKNSQRILLVRTDNRVGEALLLTPLIDALEKYERVDVLVHPKVERVLEGHPHLANVFSLPSFKKNFFRAIQTIKHLRKQPYDVVVNCGNWSEFSSTNAIISRWVGPRATVLGPAISAGRVLSDIPVQAIPGVEHEVTQRVHLLAPLRLETAGVKLSFRTPKSHPAIQAITATFATQPAAIVNPGGRLGWRRVPAEIFSASARTLIGAGRQVWITWGPGEESLAQEVVRQTPGAHLAPNTTLDDLAALMQAAGCTVCNNTGPMHLSVAVGAPTLGLFLRMPMQRWGHFYGKNMLFDLTPHIESMEQANKAVETAIQSFLRSLNAAD